MVTQAIPSWRGTSAISGVRQPAWIPGDAIASPSDRPASMHRSTAAVYRCPYTGESLRLTSEPGTHDEIVSGDLVSESGLKYPIIDGMARLVQPDRESYT